MTKDKWCDIWAKEIVYSKMYGSSGINVSRIKPLFWKQRLEKAYKEGIAEAMRDMNKAKEFNDE